MKKSITSFSPRAAMMLLATLLLTLTAQTAWAQENPFDVYRLNGGMGNLTITTSGEYDADGTIDGNLIIVAAGVTLNVKGLTVNGNIQGAESTLNVKFGLQATDIQAGTIIMNSSDGTIEASNIEATELTMTNGTITCTSGTFRFMSGTVSGGTIEASNIRAYGGTISGGTLTAVGFSASWASPLTIRGGIISATVFEILGNNTTIDATDPYLSLTVDTYSRLEGDGLFISNRDLIDGDGTVYAASATAVDLSAIAGKTLRPAYTVTFDENGGSDVSNLTVAGGSTISDPGSTKTGYTATWKKGEDVYNFTAKVENDLTLTAQWTANTYYVHFDGNGSTSGSMDNQSFTYDAALQALTDNAFDRTGYAFAGWAIAADGAVMYANQEEVQNLTADANGIYDLYAKWKKLMTNADISVIIPTQEWANSELTPEITVKDGETTLTLTTDYTVTPPSGTIQDAGDYIYTITGAGNYSGATTATFTITPKVVDNYGTWVLTVDQNGRKATFNGNYNGADQIYTTEDRYVEEVEIVRTFPTSMGSDQYSTLMLPFTVNSNNLDGVSGIYTFNGVTDDGNGNLTVNVTKVWESGDPDILDLDAYKPYLVKMNAATLVINGGVTLKCSIGAVTNVVKDNWSLNGTLGYIQWLSTNDRKDEIGSVYGFAAGTNGSTISVGDFVKVKSGAFIYPLRAYLKYSPATSARGLKRGSETLPDRIPVVVRYDSPTGIEEMERETSDGDAWFTIDGRRLSGEPTQHGIYIRQGRKHVIK